jgi:putative SOS response-associated peptidase YedK
MCGRYDFFPGEFSDLRIRFNLDKDVPDFKPSYNIAPGKDVPVIVRHGDRNIVKLMRWGLVPSWAQDPAIGNQMINARCETLDQKPSFKQPARAQTLPIPGNRPGNATRKPALSGNQPFNSSTRGRLLGRNNRPSMASM